MNRPRTSSAKDRLEEVSHTRNVGVTPSTLRHTESTIRNERVCSTYSLARRKHPAIPVPRGMAGAIAVPTPPAHRAIPRRPYMLRDLWLSPVIVRQFHRRHPPSASTVMPSGAPISSATVTSTRSSEIVPRSASNLNAWTTRGPLSTRYIVPPSGLQPSPLEIVRPPEHRPRLSVAIQPIERSATGMVGLRDGPEPVLRIASGIVHPRPWRGDLGEQAQRAVRGQVDEAEAGCQQPTLVALHRRYRGSLSGFGPGPQACLSRRQRLVQRWRREASVPPAAGCQLLVSSSAPDVRAACPWPTRTSMRLACTSSALGTRICSTPSWAEASIASAMTWLGRVMERRKRP
jgi:hypothetical protein